ncbi:MAG: branched-chain amino acid ABC transporter substrate-binding protein [Anaerolineae bacterium]|nr:branched-chain amino acid ABC transporter substrate-binding protein [Anaerolineae bacterium]
MNRRDAPIGLCHPKRATAERAKTAAYAPRPSIGTGIALSTASRFALALLLVLVGLTGVACGRSKVPTKGPLTVYVAVPLSGWQADGGQTVLGGARLAAEEINARGGVLGYRLEVVGIDDEADSDVALDVANQIATAVRGGVEPVLGVIGHYNSGQSEVALEVYKDLPIVVITPTASDPALTQRGYRNFFRVNATDAVQGPYDAQFIVEDLAAERIVVVHADNTYGRGLADQIVPALTGLGRPPLEVIEIPEAANSYADAVAQIQAQSPDLVFLAGYETEGYVLLPELREAGVQAEFLASDGCFLYDFVDGSGPWAEGAYVSAITPDPTSVADEAWWRAYQNLEARNPGTYSVAGYSAMAVMAAGAKAAESLDAGAISAALREIELSTLVGEVNYDAQGDLRQQQAYIFQVREGEFVQVKPAP